MNELLKVLIERDELTKKEALLWLKDCAAMVNEGEDAADVLMDELGLEPDYIFDLIEYC
jgi:hypothetical protein